MKKTVKYFFTAAVSTAVVSGIMTGSNFMEQNVYAEEYVNEAEYELVTASTEGNWQYELNSGSITITKYTGTESSVTIPSAIGEYKVKRIGKSAFEGNTSLKSVVIPENIVEIGDCAFKNCSNLSNITINAIELADCSSYSDSGTGDHYYSVFYGTGTNTDGIVVTFGIGVKRVPAYLFATGQEKSSDVYPYVTTVNIPDSVTSIGKCAFKHCYDLKTVNWGNSIQTIGDYAFESCNMTSVSLPNSVKTIEKGAFAECSQLKNVTIPENVVKLGEVTFKNCVNLTNVTINAIELADCDSYSGMTSDNSYSVFYGAGTNTDGIAVTFGNKVKRIPAYLFATGHDKTSDVYCYIKSVTIPDSVTFIGKSAFKNCYRLVTINGMNKVQTIDENAFESTGIIEVKLPESLIKLESCAFKNCFDLNNVVINAVEMADLDYYDTVFYGAGKAADNMNVVFGPSVTYIPKYLLATRDNKAENVYCHVKNVFIHSGTKVIGNCAFKNCYDLSSVTYYGSSSAWSKIVIGEENTWLTEANRNYDMSDLTGWSEEGFWYENGVKQGVQYNEDGSIDLSYRGKEIYDPSSNAWYWLDNVQNGAVAKSKDVYQESAAGAWADNKVYNKDGSLNPDASTGKWVRYDENGHMLKGWQTNEAGTYYFDTVYGTMAKGHVIIGDNECYFDENTGIGYNGWLNVDGMNYWYENGIRQGYNVNDKDYRGKEIYDSASDAWYWLDNVQNGAVAKSKDVYQESYAGAFADRPDGTGKWVRYDENGHMIKGWSEMNGNTYYFDYQTGAMAKGWANIDGVYYYFDEATGIRV